MSGVKLYHFPISGPSRAAVLAARVNEIPVELITINLLKKEQLSESFKKINPQHCVPTLDDNGFILWESRAIACYLTDKYGKDETLYPKDIQKRAIVNQRLYFDNSFVYPRIRAICHPLRYGGATTIPQNLRDELNTTLGFLNQFLSDSKWVAGENLTIADTAILASLSSILQVGWDMSEFPNIQRWYKQCENIPGFEENLEGAKLYGEAVRKNLKE